jgi:hypothetical protein
VNHPPHSGRHLVRVLGVLLTAATVSSCGSQPEPPRPPAPAPAATVTHSPVPTTVGPGDVQIIPPVATPSRPPRGAAGRAQAVDRHNPDSVGAQFVKLAWSSDTAVDRTLADTSRRAAPLATPTLARQLRTAVSAAAPGAQWETWAAHHAITRVSLRPNTDDGRPTDTPTTVYRAWQAQITPVGDNGWTGSGQTLVVYVELTKSAGQWAVSDLRVGQ